VRVEGMDIGEGYRVSLEAFRGHAVENFFSIGSA